MMRTHDDALVEVGYIYTFVISALLMAGMLVMTSNFLVESDERTNQRELDAITDYLLASYDEVQHLAAKHPDSTIEKTVRLPSLHGGSDYTIRLDNRTATVHLAGQIVFTRELGAYQFVIDPRHDTVSNGGEYIISYEPAAETIQFLPAI